MSVDVHAAVPMCGAVVTQFDTQPYRGAQPCTRRSVARSVRGLSIDHRLANTTPPVWTPTSVLPPVPMASEQQPRRRCAGGRRVLLALFSAGD